MRILIVSPTKSGVKNVVYNVGGTDAWTRTDSTHLTIPLHETPEGLDQRSILNERLLRALEPYQPLYLLYAVLWFWLRAYVHVRRHHAEFDVVWLNQPRLLALAVFPDELTAKTVITYHGPLHRDKRESHGGLRRMYYSIFGLIEAIGIRYHRDVQYTAVSRPVVESLRGRGVPAENSHYIGNGVDVEQFRRMSDPEVERGEYEDIRAAARPVFLYVGRLSPEKGIRRLLDAFEVIETDIQPDPLPLLLVAGDGPLREVIESAVESRVTKTVEYRGYVDHSDIVTLYNAADYYVHPSKYEGASTPLSLSEAMACGLPVFVSELDVFSELAEESFVWTVDFARPGAAARTLVDGIESSEERAERADVARAFVEEELRWGRRAEQYLELFETVANHCPDNSSR